MVLDEFTWLEDIDRSVLGPHFEHDSASSEVMSAARRGIALLPLFLVKYLIDDDPAKVESLTKSELLRRTPMFVSRSRFFVTVWNEWQPHIARTENSGPWYVNEANLFHQYAPHYVQELEAPLAYQLAALIDLTTSYTDGDGDWKDRLYEPNGRKRYFHELIDQAKDQTGRVKDEFGWTNTFALRFLNQDPKLLEELGVEAEHFPKVSEIRNSIGHGDYTIWRADDDTLQVTFYVYDRTAKTYVEVETSLSSALRFIHESVLIMRFLAAGVSLSLFHAANSQGRVAEAMEIIDAYESEMYPPSSSESLAEEFRE